jgi:GMP synthase (glutamine-hydrolysing)
MRLLVLQARLASDPMLEHERRCFAAATGRDRSELDFHNLIDGIPSIESVSRFDALLIGGSGSFSVAHPDEAFFKDVAELLRWAVHERHPTFGSCFGYQLLVDALGGRVENDPEHGEVGSFLLDLTEDGKHDPLFGSLPGRFVAQLGHLDRATELPAGVINLASSRRSPLQALRVPDAPIWATQFHPELDQNANHDRYVAYIERYGGGEKDAEFRSLPSPEASTLLPRFLELVVTPEG